MPQVHWTAVLSRSASVGGLVLIWLNPKLGIALISGWAVFWLHKTKEWLVNDDDYYDWFWENQFDLYLIERPILDAPHAHLLFVYCGQIRMHKWKIMCWKTWQTLRFESQTRKRAEFLIKYDWTKLLSNIANLLSVQKGKKWLFASSQLSRSFLSNINYVFFHLRFIVLFEIKHIPEWVAYIELLIQR